MEHGRHLNNALNGDQSIASTVPATKIPDEPFFVSAASVLHFLKKVTPKELAG